MPKRKQSGSNREAPSFEEAMDKVEEIVDAMESDSLPLEQMLSQYEEGSRLLAQCQKLLDDAQKRIDVIASERKNQVVTLKEFEGNEAPLHSPLEIEPQQETETELKSPDDPDQEEIRLF